MAAAGPNPMDEVKMIVESAIEAPSDTDAAVVVAFLIAQGVTKKTDLDAFDSIDELKFEATFVEKKRMLKAFRGGACSTPHNRLCPLADFLSTRGGACSTPQPAVSTR
jgi:hypothetical protein